MSAKKQPAERVPLQRLVSPLSGPVKVNMYRGAASDARVIVPHDAKNGGLESAMLVPLDDWKRMKRIERAAEAFNQSWWVPTAHLEKDERALRLAMRPVKRANDEAERTAIAWRGVGRGVMGYLGKRLCERPLWSFAPATG